MPFESGAISRSFARTPAGPSKKASNFRSFGRVRHISGLNAAVQPGRRGRFALVVWAWVFGLCLASLIATYILFVEPPPPLQYRDRDWQLDRRILPLRSKIRGRVKKRGPDRRMVRETAGSVENLQLLRQPGSGVSVAIVQSGVADPEDVQQLMCWAACTTNHCGSSTAATNRSDGSVSLGANASVSVQRAVAPTRSPCVSCQQTALSIQ